MKSFANLIILIEHAGFVLGYDNWDRYDFRALLQLLKNLCFINLGHEEEYYGDLSSDCFSSYPLTGEPTSSACIKCAVNGITTTAVT